MSDPTRIFVLNGPNLNLLGQREPAVYGRATLAEIEAHCVQEAQTHGAKIDFRQTNHEGALIDWIQEAGRAAQGLVLNAGGYTHTSVAILDALRTLAIPIVEVHLSQPAAREAYRARSYPALAASGSIAGFGPLGYRLAIWACVQLARERSP